MATILNNAAYMALPMNIKRGNPIPLDTTAVWYDKTELETYAASGATAYVGQVLTLVADGKCEAYMISSEAGTLVKLAQTTASGDLATDVSNLQTQVDNLTKAVGSAAAEGTEASGLYKLIADVEAMAKARLESVEAGDNSITIASSATKPSVAVKVSQAVGNALSLADDGLKVEIPEVKVPVYSLIKDETAAAGDIATYHLTKDGVNEGVAINIPKDLVVSSGSVVELETGKIPEDAPEGTTAGTYIKLVLANSAKPLYINVGSLIEYVTGGSSETDAIQINVSSDTHKVTASVKQGSLTKEMLAADVVASLGKANSAVQAVAAGDANGTIKVDGTEVAITGLQDAAYATVKSINDTAQGYVNTAKAALEGATTDTDEFATIAGAKKYADKVAGAAEKNAGTALTTEIGKLKNDDKAVDNKFVTTVKEANGVVTVERKALVAANIPDLGMSKITGLEDALGGKQDSLTFDGDYKAGVNNAATVSTVNATKTALIGDISTEAATTDGNTIADVRRYVDAKTKGIASDAKLAELTEKVIANTNSIKGINTSLADGGAISNAIVEANKAGTGAAAAVNTLAGKVGTVTEGKTVVKMIEEAQAAATYDDTTVKADIKKNVDAIAAINDAKTGILQQAKTYADDKDTVIAEAKKAGTDAAEAVKTLEDGQVKKNADAISVLNGTSAVDGSVDKKVADAINEFSTKISDNGTVDTFKELIDYAATHKNEYSTLSGEVQKNTTAIATLNGDGAGSVDKKVADAIAAINKYVEKNGTDRLITEAEGTKLASIAEGAQVNVIESIKVNNVTQTATGKAVNIAVPVADDTSIAITENKIGIKAVDVQKLFIAEGDVLIIDGGKA